MDLTGWFDWDSGGFWHGGRFLSLRDEPGGYLFTCASRFSRPFKRAVAHIHQDPHNGHVLYLRIPVSKAPKIFVSHIGREFTPMRGASPRRPPAVVSYQLFG
jgi:hypothetical protein